ncbi:MAG TPA: TolC family protein [Bacteroidota bacterium]|nr:TolC family protein [Bacteroidota bacterium]
MTMRRVRLLSLLTLFALAAGAQTELRLTEEQAMNLALENSRALHASLMRVNYADARASEVNAGRLPSLKVTGAYTRLSDVPPFAVALPPQLGGNSFVLAPSVLNNYTLKASVEQPLFTGLKLEAASSAADLSARAAEQEHARNRAEILYNVRVAYWSLFKAMEFKKVIDETVEQMKAHLRDVQSMMDQGMATTNDVLKVQVQLSDAELRRIEADNNVQLAMIALNNAIGIPLQTRVVIDSEPGREAAVMETDLHALVERALERRPELNAGAYRVKAAEAGVTAARGGWWPQVFLAANYYYNRPNQRIQPVQDVFKDTWDVTIGVSLDIWNWGKTLHQSDQASAQLEEARDALAQLKDAVTLDVTQSYLNLQQAKQRIRVAEEGVQQAQESYRITNKRFKEGLAQNSDLLDAEVALLQARTNFTQARVDFALAHARLQKAIGE